jgi:hypothetical protein
MTIGDTFVKRVMKATLNLSDARSCSDAVIISFWNHNYGRNRWNCILYSCHAFSW